MKEAMLLSKMCVLCTRQLDFQDPGASKNKCKSDEITMLCWDVLWNHFYNDFKRVLRMVFGVFRRLLAFPSQGCGPRKPLTAPGAPKVEAERTIHPRIWAGPGRDTFEAPRILHPSRSASHYQFCSRINTRVISFYHNRCVIVYVFCMFYK